MPVLARRGATRGQIVKNSTDFRLSGAVGPFLGDVLGYAATVRLGPRRTVVMMATSSPMAIGFGAAFRGEIFSLRIHLGIVLILFAVLNPGRFDIKEDQGRNCHEVVVGVAWMGMCIALVDAAFQAGGILLAKPALVDEVNSLQFRILHHDGHRTHRGDERGPRFGALCGGPGNTDAARHRPTEL